MLETSALLPTLTNVERPMWRSAARPRIAMPSAPLCDESATCPPGGKTGENDAFSRTSGLMLSSPMQLGPTIRMPYPRAFSTSASCRARPSAPSLREAGRDHDERLDAGRGAIVDRRQDGIAAGRR